MNPLLLALLFSPLLAYAQLSITGSGTYTIDFDNTVTNVNNGQFAGSGFTPTPATGQLDSDAWRATGFSDGDGTFGGTHATLDFARGTHNGGTNIGGVYAFQTATGDYCLGVQPDGNGFTPGTFTLKVQNNSGATISALNLSYEIKVLNDQDRSNSFNFRWSTDDVTYTPVGTLDYASPAAADPTPAWSTVSRNTTLSGLNLANGAFLYLQWISDDISGSGARDEFGLDDVVLDEVVLSGNALPVELVAFNAQAKGQHVVLNWETASELKNREFQIEHSTDGEDFWPIATVPGNGTSLKLQQYEFWHENPPVGINYYRLKQVDEDGQFNYSPIVTATVSGASSPLITYNAREKKLRVVLSEIATTDTKLLLYDLSGRQAATEVIPAGTAETRMSAAGLRPGVYLLQLRQPNNSETAKLLIYP